MSKFLEDDPRCALCGALLTGYETSLAMNNNQPGACKSHLIEVVYEAANDYSLWPDYYFGHWFKETEGYWTYSPIG